MAKQEVTSEVGADAGGLEDASVPALVVAVVPGASLSPDAMAMMPDTSLSPDVMVKPDAGVDAILPMGAYMTPYPACAWGVEVTPSECSESIGSCRTVDNYPCVTCAVTTPCAYWKERSGIAPVRKTGPGCAGGRICMAKCPVTMFAQICTLPDGGQ